MTSEGLLLSEPISYIRHWSRQALQLVVGVAAQMDPSIIPRIDSDLFLSSISCVIDGKRIRAPSWDLAPGWTGEDVLIGKDYTELLQSEFGVDSLSELDPEALTRLWNSDNHMTDHPFNKPQLTQIAQRWKDHSNHQKRSIPVCVAVGDKESESDRFQAKRRGQMTSALNKSKKKRMRGQEEEEEEEEEAEASGSKSKKARNDVDCCM
jgi:hypothetical protein